MGHVPLERIVFCLPSWKPYIVFNAFTTITIRDVVSVSCEIKHGTDTTIYVTKKTILLLRSVVITVRLVIFESVSQSSLLPGNGICRCVHWFYRGNRRYWIKVKHRGFSQMKLDGKTSHPFLFVRLLFYLLGSSFVYGLVSKLRRYNYIFTRYLRLIFFSSPTYFSFCVDKWRVFSM